MTLQDRIVTYVTKNKYPVSLEKLLSVATAKGFSEDEVLEVLQRLGKRLKATVRKDDVYYSRPTAPKRQPNSHISWLRNNYPWPDTFVMPFPEIDMSWIVLSPEEMKQYKADAKGMPMFMYNTTNGNTRGNNTKRDTRRAA